MRPRTLLVIVALFAAVVTGQQSTGRAAVAELSGPPVIRRASVAQLSTDTGRPLRSCDPSAPAAGFSFVNGHAASLPGFTGTIIQGTVISHCTAIAGDVSMGALFIGKDGTLIGTSSFRADFGLIQPGQGSPFVALTPLSAAQIGKVLIAVAHFTPVTGAVPVLELKRGVPTFLDGGVSVPYTVRNSGDAPAALPRIAGRLNGLGCTDPFALEFLQDGSPLAAGGSLSGNLFIPSSCSGVPEVNAGSDRPPGAGLPPGLSFASVRSLYTADGVLHLVANVCNNSPQEAFLPQFRVQFKGAAVMAFTLGESGIYSGNSCAPLLAAIPTAPPGLTFDKVLSAGGQSAAQVGTPTGRLDLGTVKAKPAAKPDPCSKEDQEHFFELALGFPEIEGDQLSPECQKAFDDFFGPFNSTSSGGQVADASAPSLLLSFLYNKENAPLSASAYRVQTLGYGRDGSLLAGIDIASPPSLPARGWGIGVTPLDATSVVAADGDEFRIDGEGFAIPK